MELLPLGSVVMIDTPGLDDTGELGALRIQKTYQILNKTDIALVVIDTTVGMTDADAAILTRILEKEIPYLLVWNKADQLGTDAELKGDFARSIPKEHSILISASTGSHIHELKEKLASLVPTQGNDRRIVSDLIRPGDFVVLVVPIDKAAPKGRLILPQQQTIRDILQYRSHCHRHQRHRAFRYLESAGRTAFPCDY